LSITFREKSVEIENFDLRIQSRYLRSPDCQYVIRDSQFISLLASMPPGGYDWRMENQAPAKDCTPCPECQGSGFQAMGCNLFTCPECGGKGVGKGEEEQGT
jgi:hypothetical protein